MSEQGAFFSGPQGDFSAQSSVESEKTDHLSRKQKKKFYAFRSRREAYQRLEKELATGDNPELVEAIIEYMIPKTRDTELSQNELNAIDVALEQMLPITEHNPYKKMWALWRKIKFAYKENRFQEITREEKLQFAVLLLSAVEKGMLYGSAKSVLKIAYYFGLKPFMKFAPKVVTFAGRGVMKAIPALAFFSVRAGISGISGLYSLMFVETERGMLEKKAHELGLDTLGMTDEEVSAMTEASRKEYQQLVDQLAAEGVAADNFFYTPTLSQLQKKYAHTLREKQELQEKQADEERRRRRQAEEEYSQPKSGKPAKDAPVLTQEPIEPLFKKDERRPALDEQPVRVAPSVTATDEGRKPDFVISPPEKLQPPKQTFPPLAETTPMITPLMNESEPSDELDTWSTEYREYLEEMEEEWHRVTQAEERRIADFFADNQRQREKEEAEKAKLLQSSPPARPQQNSRTASKTRSN
ncbi:hypothetical protein KBC79_04075 [Candidatus Woesebacteria bacterium]|nr:hypothetical protein [Candidatus Woesebacteria bacterium]